MREKAKQFLGVAFALKWHILSVSTSILFASFLAALLGDFLRVSGRFRSEVRDIGYNVSIRIRTPDSDLAVFIHFHREQL